jgi:hypothetical protein
MKLKPLIVMLLGAGLLFGCAKTPSGDFCDIARPIYFDGEIVVDWLLDNDEQLLRNVVAHNEIVAKCR